MSKVIKDLCKVCNEERETDLVGHGLGIAIILYLPCRHIKRTEKGKPTIWTDKDYHIVLTGEV